MQQVWMPDFLFIKKYSKDMTREQAKEMLPIIKAFADGKEIEHYNEETRTWSSNKRLRFTDDPTRYRVKTEPEYEPFESYEECWEEMMKHSYLGWVKDSRSRLQIVKVDSNYVYCIGFDMEVIAHCFDYMFEYYKFIDGTPFGKLKQ